MRTKEQIRNLRKVLVGVYGPGMLFVTDDEIDTWADMFQDNIDSIVHLWHLRVKTDENSEVPFKDIEREPRVIRASKKQIVKKVEEMMKSYPSLYSMQFVIVDSPNDVLTFGRDGEYA